MLMSWPLEFNLTPFSARYDTTRSSDDARRGLKMSRYLNIPAGRHVSTPQCMEVKRPSEHHCLCSEDIQQGAGPVVPAHFPTSTDYTHTLSTQSEKTSRFIPLPNKPCPKGYKDFGLAALTSILVKSFKGIISNMRINRGYA